MAHFEIEDLTFSYPAAGAEKEPALMGVNLSIENGEYIAICGRSGSGKTTLLRHLKGVLTPHGKRSGRILFGGRPISEVGLREQSSEIGYVMQDPDDQIVTDKVWHELAFGLESLGCDQNTIRLRVAEMASYFGIQGWFHRDVAELSGGQKQLLNLASIMAMQPSALILDEPTSQLDPIAASDFLNTVKKINLELGTTIIITEHRLEDIFHAADRVAVMEDGKLIAVDAPRRVGEFLNREGNEMFEALPAPVRIYHGVNGTAVADGGERTPKGMVSECPLTVREGRGWLSTVFGDKKPEYTSVEQLSGGTQTAGVPLENRGAATDDTPALQLKEVWYRYERDLPDVLKGVSLEVPKGSLFAVVGGNGTGKTTALRAIAGICRPYRGKVLIDGKRVEKFKADELFHGNLAMLPQDPKSLFVKKTVRDDLAEMLTAAERRAAAGSADGAGSGMGAIAEVAEICEITDLLGSHPYDLSGGERQRAALAKVLLTMPKLLLLDEPTKGMDAFFKLKFAEIIGRLKKRGVTVLMVSHDVEFCARFADYVSMFFDGSVITTNTPEKFFAKNSFYTTAANRMSRHVFNDAITSEDVIKLCQRNL